MPAQIPGKGGYCNAVPASELRPADHDLDNQLHRVFPLRF
jgi:hypothetical protein